MISFKAKLIGSTTIQCYNNKKKAYEDCNVSFIRFSKHSKSDLMAVQKVSKMWQPQDKYAKNIAKNFCYEYSKKYNQYYNDNFFALTLQDCNYENVDPTKVLGMAEALKKRKTFYLDFLQTNPKYKYGDKKRKYKNIGTAIIESLKNIKRIKSIILIPNNFAVKFYEKCGFTEKHGMMQYTKEKSNSFYRNLLDSIKLKDLLKRKRV